jgi:hypothetical protein
MHCGTPSLKQTRRRLSLRPFTQWLAAPPANQNLIGDEVSSAHKTTFPRFPGFAGVMAQYPTFLAKALNGEVPARDALTELAQMFDQVYSSSPFRLAGG